MTAHPIPEPSARDERNLTAKAATIVLHCLPGEKPKDMVFDCAPVYDLLTRLEAAERKLAEVERRIQSSLRVHPGQLVPGRFSPDESPVWFYLVLVEEAMRDTEDCPTSNLREIECNDCGCMYEPMTDSGLCPQCVFASEEA